MSELSERIHEAHLALAVHAQFSPAFRENGEFLTIAEAARVHHLILAASRSLDAIVKILRAPETAKW